MTGEFRQSPYPTVAEAQAYEVLQPGAFDRILAMTEKGQQAEIEAAERGQRFAREDSRRGQYLGAAVTGTALLSAVALGYFGQAAIAALALGMPVLTVAKSLVEAWREPRPNRKR